MDAITLDSNFTLSTPVHDKLDTYFMVLIFLDSSMAIIIAFLCLLAIQLIYSLMLSDVSDKTYTFGLLRALGFKTSNLITLISMQSFMFSLPGLCLGMVVAALINVLMRFGIFFYSANSMTYMLSDRAVMIGTVIGLCVPMVTNIFPVQKALDVSLRSSLDPLNRQS
jgi:ABC-type antimicrobial peptide transport system permease subunit